MIKELTCKVCGIAIEKGTRGSGRLYCSDLCGWRARNARRRKGSLRALPKQSKTVPPIQVRTEVVAGAAAWEAHVRSTYELTESEATLVTLAAGHLEVALAARALVLTEGILVNKKVNPAIQIGQSASALFHRIVKQLNFPVDDSAQVPLRRIQ